MKTIYLVFLLIILIVLAFFVSAFVPPRSASPDIVETPIIATTTEEYDLIRVSSPLPNSLITSPLLIKGEARGNWYFEASFPVKLLDGNGNQIAITPVQAQGEWMTMDFVPFETTLFFTVPTTTPNGFLILEKDNPSGEPQFDTSISIPVRFN